MSQVTFKDIRVQAAELADEVQKSGVVSYAAKVNFAFLFVSSLLGAYGYEELRRIMLGGLYRKEAETGLREWDRTEK